MLPQILSCLLVASSLSAEVILPTMTLTPVSGTAQPTAILPELSKPPVTPDPRFREEAWAKKFPHISLETAQALQKRKNVVFVDGRAKVEWDLSHIPGAVILPVGEFDKYYADNKKKLMKAKILVSYCHGEGCRLSDMLAQKLYDKGFKNIAVFWGGFPAWEGAKLPLVDKKGKTFKTPTPVPTQTPGVAAPAATVTPAAP